MAKRKKNNVPQWGQLKRNLVIALWCVLVVAMLIFVAKSLIRSEIDNESNRLSQAESARLEAVKIPASRPNEQVEYTGFTIHFNKDWHMPNCVAYELTGEETRGKLPRVNNFEEDTAVEGSARPWDYTRSGYDRGHMAPAGDLKWNQDAMIASFMMTNVCPQKKSLNEGGWNTLEETLREWARRDSALIIVAGPVIGSAPEYIGKGRHQIPVPEKFFKVVLSPYTTPARAIGFVFENKSSNKSLKHYAVSVDDVEALSGIDFFASLPDDMEEQLESVCNFNAWTQP